MIGRDPVCIPGLTASGGWLAQITRGYDLIANACGETEQDCIEARDEITSKVNSHDVLVQALNIAIDEMIRADFGTLSIVPKLRQALAQVAP